MPLQMPSLPTWAQTKTTAKAGFDKVYNTVDKLGPHVNKLSNKLGAEAFWPTTIDKESDKAARILRSFCKDGFYVEEKQVGVSQDGVPKGKQRVIKKIPESVIKNAKGLAIFTVMRTGLWFSGAGGSGILIARMPNGEWSPPSGIVLHTAGLGFLAGADIYDCVMVINTETALQAFTKLRCTVGGEVSAVAGPVGIGGVLETELHKRQAPVWNYLKSRGLYGGIQVDGTVIVERMDENEKFYGQRIPVQDILAGKVRHPPREILGLINTIKAAQGDKDIDESVMPSFSEPTPGDYKFSDDGSTFGLPPDLDTDPDPFGVKSLQEEGMEIREAGTNNRPSADAFAYKPAPTSPIYNAFKEQERRRSIRKSFTHSRGISVDSGTQTGEDPVSPPTPTTKYQLRAPPPLPPRQLSDASVYSEAKGFDEEDAEKEVKKEEHEQHEETGIVKESDKWEEATWEKREPEGQQAENTWEKKEHEDQEVEHMDEKEVVSAPEPVEIMDKPPVKVQEVGNEDSAGWQEVALGR